MPLFPRNVDMSNCCALWAPIRQIMVRISILKANHKPDLNARVQVIENIIILEFAMPIIIEIDANLFS